MLQLRRFDAVTIEHFVFLEQPEGGTLEDSATFEPEREYARATWVTGLIASAQEYAACRPCITPSSAASCSLVAAGAFDPAQPVAADPVWNGPHPRAQGPGAAVTASRSWRTRSGVVPVQIRKAR